MAFKAAERWFHAWLDRFVRASSHRRRTHIHWRRLCVSQHRPWICLPRAWLTGMDVVSELMEQGDTSCLWMGGGEERSGWSWSSSLPAVIMFVFESVASGSFQGFWAGDTPPHKTGCVTIYRAPPFVYNWLGTHPSSSFCKYVSESHMYANDTNVPKSPPKNVWGSITIKTFCFWLMWYSFAHSSP